MSGGRRRSFVLVASAILGLQMATGAVRDPSLSRRTRHEPS